MAVEDLIKTRVHIVKCAESDYQKLTYKNPLCIYITNATGDFSAQTTDSTANIYIGAYQVATNVIIPGENDTMQTVVSKYIVQSTGGNTDILTGDAKLLKIKGSLDERMNPFLADTFVSTSMNLVDPEQYVEIDGHKAFYFFVDKGVIGTPGTTQENNGYIILNGNVSGVYYKRSKPTAASYGTACGYTTVEGHNQYTPSDIGWLTIVTNDNVAPACHLVWSGRHNDEAGVFGNFTKQLLAAIQSVHSYGLTGLVGPYDSSYDELDLEALKGYGRNNMVLLADLSWTKSTVVVQGHETNQFVAQISGMKTEGLYKTTYNPEGATVSVVGPTVTITSDNITTVEALLESLGLNKICYQKATTSVVNLSNITPDFRANDMGLCAFLYNGDLATVPAVVEESYYLGVSDQILNAVAEISIISRIMAEALCSLRADVDAIDVDNAGDIRCKSVDSDDLPKFCGYPSRIEQALPDNTAPAVTPDFIGQEFYDTYNRIIYKAIGVSSASDWLRTTTNN